MSLRLAVSLAIPLSFWDGFPDTIPRLICETPYFVHHRVVVMPTRFKLEYLLKISRSFVEASKDVPLALLYMAPRYDVVGSYVSTGKDSNFENWRYRAQLDLESRAEPVKDIAQLNIIDGEAVLRVRIAGRVSRYVLTARDPLRYKIDGQEFEILEFYGDLSGKEVKREYLDGGMLSVNWCENCVTRFDVAVRTTGELRMGPFRELVKRLARIDIPADLNVSLRRDTWFVPSLTFPLVYAFDETVPRLPTREEYELAGELRALVDRESGRILFSEYIRRRRVDRGSELISDR